MPFSPTLDMGALPATLLASLTIAVIVLALRIIVLQGLAAKRQRENRQHMERLRALVDTYRCLAGSFSPAQPVHTNVLEEALANVVLFGTLQEVQLAVDCVHKLQAGESPDYQPLIEVLRTDLRGMLGLEAITADLNVPLSGPTQFMRASKRPVRPISSNEGNGEA